MTASIAGCPTGLSPPSPAAATVDPSPFVRVSGATRSLELSVSGAKCAGCIAKIEGAVGALPGMISVRLNLSTGKLAAQWSGALAPGAITATVSRLGYQAIPFDPVQADDTDKARGRDLLRALAVAGFAAANIMLLSVAVWAGGAQSMPASTRDLFHLVSALIAIPTVFYAGQPFFRSAYAALRHGRANMDVPISLGVLLALLVSMLESLRGGAHAYFDAAVMLLFFLLIGRWLDEAMRTRARTAAREVLALQGKTALRRHKDGSVATVATADILPGDILVIEPGSRLPVNARIVEGLSELDQAVLTGEAEPVLAKAGDVVLAGARNLTHRIIVCAQTDAAHSMLADIVRLIEAGQQTRDKYTILADRAARAYVPVVHSLAAATFLGWLIIAKDLHAAIINATAVLIITCPCALGLATPIVQVVATGQLFRRGILVKSGDALERLARVRHIVFDKTGTLTKGELRWQNPDVVTGTDRDAAAALARSGHHTMARALARYFGPGPLADNVTEVPGEGMDGQFGAVHVRFGQARFVGLDDPAPGGLSTWLRVGDQPPVRLTFADAVRPDSAAAIKRLTAAGIGVSIASGDDAGVVREIATALGIASAEGRMGPAEKAAAISAARFHGPVAMVGDGINDAPALAHADVSLAPGGAADAAQTQADFVYVNDGITAVATARRMAVRARHNIVQNFAFAFAYNAVAAPLAMAGLVTPLIAALAMSGSSLVVTVNALRLMRGRDIG